MPVFPILYEANETDFFGLGLGPLKTATSAIVYEERNGAFYLETEVTIDDIVYPTLQENMILKADAGHELKAQRFRIKRIVPSTKGKATIYAEHIRYLANELSIKPEVKVSGSGQNALDRWKQSIVESNPFEVYSDITRTSSTEWRIDKIQSPADALGGVEGSILDKWGGEYRFDNYRIHLLQKRGSTANTVLAYGRNIVDLEQERNITNVYTSVYPYAIYTDDKSVEHLVTIDGYVVDCKNIDNYPNRNVLPVDFSTEFDHDEKPTKANLKTLAEQYIENNNVGIPETSITVSFLDLSKTLDYKDISPLEELNLCDEVFIFYEKLGINTTAKVISVTWNVLNETYDQIEIGAKRTTLQTILKEQQNQIKEINNQTNSALLAANGKNLIFYGLYGDDGLGEPTALNVGDMWYKPDGDLNTEMYVWNGTVWEFIMSTKTLVILESEIEDIKNSVADAQAAADEAKTAGEEAAQLANEAKTESAKALEDANAAINSVSYLGQIVQAVDKASQLAIEQSANAVADAQAAMVKANELLTSVNEIEGTITNITADIDAINGELAVKVDQTTFNQLKGTVDTHTTSISANAQAIKLKANQSTVDTISGKVNANSAELSVQADKISGLVTKTDGQSTQIANLELQAGQFNLTLSSVQSDIDGINSNDNLIDKTFTFTNNKDISITTGLEDTGKRTIINEFIPVVPNNTYVFYKPEKSGNVGFRAYTAEKAYIGAPGKSNETDRSAMFKTPANCYFIRFIDESNKLTKGYRLQVASATVTALTSVQATVDGLVTTVATKANQSQVTQLANQITSVVTEVNKKAYDYKYRTRNSGSTDNNKWYKILTSTLTAQYQDTRTGLTLIGSSSGDSITRSADIFINVKQQAVMGSAPAVEIGVIGCSRLVPEDFAAVLTENSSSKTIVEVYLKNRATYTIYNIEPYNVVTPSRQEFVDSAVPIVSLPTGTQWVGKKRGAMEGLETVSSQITQLSDQINLRVTKDDVVNQINISPSGVLIAANKIQITGLTKIDNAVIATAHIKDLAITNAKIANLAVNTAKIGDAAIVTAKIGDLAVTNAKIANLAINDAKIQNASISSAKIISLDANKIVANTLSAITTNTGTLNVSGWLSITSDNKGLSGTYDFGDQYGGAVNARWFDGNWRLSHRHLLFSGSIYEVNSNNTKGKFLYDGETFLGADYFKLRQYNSGMTVLKNRVDITAAQISMGDLSNYNSKVLINSNGTLWLDDSMTVGGVYIKDLKPLNVYHIEAVESANNLYFNNDRTDLADFRIGKDGSTVNGGRLISSMAIYNRTYGAIAQVGITASGALGRITSARKYKRDILIADKVIANSKKVLSITPVSWKDKVEVLDGNAVNRYYGFIADDFHEAGLTEVVIYGENGEIESLAYDRITMYHNVILSEHEKEINLLKKKVEILENEIRVLQVA